MEELEDFIIKAFERGKQTPFVRSDPFVLFGFEANPFVETSISQIQHQSFLRPKIYKVADVLGKVIASNLEGVIVSHAHNGTTTVVKSVFSILKSRQEEFNGVVYLDAKKFVAFEQFYYSVTESIVNFKREILNTLNNPKIVIIDHADYLADFFVSFKQAIEYDFPELKMVYIFTPSGWAKVKSLAIYENYDLYNTTLPAIFLDPLTTEHIEEMLLTKLSVNGSIHQPFTRQVIRYIAKVSNNSIRNAIQLSTRVCEECFYNGLDYATEHIVKDIYNTLFHNIPKTIQELISSDDTKLFILSLVAMKSVGHDLGITYEEITNNIDLQKTTISYHLKQLEKQKIIFSKKVHRKAYYKLNPLIQSFADTFLLPKFEAKEQYVKLESTTDTSV